MSVKLFQKILPTAKVTSIFEDNADKILRCLKTYKGQENAPIKMHGLLEENLEELNISKHDPEVVNIQAELNYTKSSCTTCNIDFEHYEAQREHFTLDWHRYNIKQKSCGKSTLSEEVFEEQIGGELSSISGSDTEDEDLEPTAVYKREMSEEEKIAEQNVSIFLKHPSKRFYTTADAILVSLYRNVLLEPPSEPADEAFDAIPQCKQNCIWAYLMLSAGHFAAAVFDRKKVLAHKTFHRYTVRAKRGTIQGIQDKKQGPSKSAGATLRRYNEAALAEDITNLLETWSENFKEADKIFFKCSMYHMNILFGEKSPLSRDDPRVMKISAMTNRPTLKEVQRIHSLFSNIEIYGSASIIEESLQEFSITKSTNPNRLIPPNQPTIQQDDIQDQIKKSPKTSHKKNTNKKTTKTKPNDTGKTKKEKEDFVEKPARVLCELELLWNKLYKNVMGGEIEVINSFLDGTSYSQECGENVVPVSNPEELKIRSGFLHEDYINFCSPDHGETLLHSAVKQNNKEIINALLMANADPCVVNSQGKVPYDIAVEKDTRNEFRRFMAKFPEKYDYKNAKIPSPLTEEHEQEQQRKTAEKKRQQQKAKKERLKGKKAIERQDKKAEKEHRAFEAMSDREKRAVMAERRFANQLSSSLRCSHCRNPLDEKNMFERYEYKYCSVDCVQAHKKTIGK